MKNNRLRIIFVAFMLVVNIVCQRVYANPADNTPQQPISFGDYLNTVGRKNLGLLVEKYNVKIAGAGIIAARIMPDPEIGFEATDETYNLELGYTLELGNKRGARVRLAKSEAEVAGLALEHFFQELRAEAADAFLDAVMQRELLSVKQSSYNYMLQLSKSDSIRFSKGEINENDARQSRLEAATLLNDVYNQEAEYKSSLAILNQFMGRAADTLNIPQGEWDNFDREYILSDLITIASDNRIDLMTAQKSSQAAVNQLKLAKAEQKMDLGLSIGYEREWQGAFPTRNSMKAGISIPLKFSNMNKGSIKAASYAVDQSKHEIQNLWLQMQAEVSRAFYQYEALKKQVRQYHSGLLEDSKKVLEGMVYKYKRGETSILDVLIARRTYNEVQEQYLETMKNHASALVNLQKTCGIWDIGF